MKDCGATVPKRLTDTLAVGFAEQRAEAVFVTAACAHYGSSATVARHILGVLGNTGREMARWVLEQREPCARRCVVVFGEQAHAVEIHVPVTTAKGGAA